MSFINVTARCGTVALVAIAAVVAAGASPAVARPSPQARFAARLDMLCRQGDRATSADLDRADRALSAGRYAAAANALQRVNRVFNQRFIVALRRLRPPTAIRGAFRRYREAVVRVHNIRRRVVIALRRRDLSTVVDLVGIAGDIGRARTRAAIDLGTIDCGS